MWGALDRKIGRILVLEVLDLIRLRPSLIEGVVMRGARAVMECEVDLKEEEECSAKSSAYETSWLSIKERISLIKRRKNVGDRI